MREVYNKLKEHLEKATPEELEETWEELKHYNICKTNTDTAREEQMYNAEFLANPYFFGEDGKGAPQVGAFQSGFYKGVEWADKNPSDETIMLILNCIGYEETSWIDFVKQRLNEMKNGEKE